MRAGHFAGVRRDAPPRATPAVKTMRTDARGGKGPGAGPIRAARLAAAGQRA